MKHTNKNKNRKRKTGTTELTVLNEADRRGNVSRERVRRRRRGGTGGRAGGPGGQLALGRPAVVAGDEDGLAERTVRRLGLYPGGRQTRPRKAKFVCVCVGGCNYDGDRSKYAPTPARW